MNRTEALAAGVPRPPATSAARGVRADGTAPRSDVLTRKDVVIGTLIAVAMGTLFTLLSSGASLLVTFVPGVVCTWVTYVWLYLSRTKLPNASEFLPAFFALLAVQFIHFAEEFTTGFRSSFALLYGGAPYSANLFVTFNMIAYFVFTVGAILALTRNVRFLLVPVLFYIIYGAIGNAISHTWWSLYLQSYFPGLVTAQVYWVAGPVVLHKLAGRRRVELAIIALFALVMIPLLTLFATPRAVGSP